MINVLGEIQFLVKARKGNVLFQKDIEYKLYMALERHANGDEGARPYKNKDMQRVMGRVLDVSEPRGER